jgi:hypothetical protein
MSNLRLLDEVDAEFATQDKRWNGPKFFLTGIATLIVAVSIIIYASTFTGCSLAFVP